MNGHRLPASDLQADRALAVLEQAWEPAGYHGFSGEGSVWTAISSAGEVLTGDSPDALSQAVRAHWQAMQ